MSTMLAIAGVSAVLEYYMQNAYSGTTGLFGNTVKVSAVAPDVVQATYNSPTDFENQVNLFLHQVTENAAWRNVCEPWLASDGQTQLKNPPLALDLHYLLTAYGTNDWQAEALLGYALLMLHENPVMTRQDIRTAFLNLPSSYGSNPLSTPLGSSGLADQIEMIKIVPSTMGREELAWIWTALKADYRPTYAFQVSVVLMQQPAGVSLAFPVLHRRIKAQVTVPAQLQSIEFDHGQISAAPGTQVTVTGQYLSGASQVLLANARLGIQQTATATVIDAQSLTFTVPTTIPASIYSLSILFNNASGNTIQSTSSLPFGVAPAYVSTNSVVQTGTSTQVTITVSPALAATQGATFTLGSQSSTIPPVDSATSTLQFTFAPPLNPVSYLARLVVDGAPSIVSVNWNAHPPVFTGPMVTI
jgi:hypothetical protein